MFALSILCVKIDRKLEKFLHEMKNKYSDNYDIYIFCDFEEKEIKSKYENINIIQMSHLEATKNGYKDILLRYYHRKDTKQKSFALDKALYFFTYKTKKIYKHYWFIEDDAFIPHIDTINNLNLKYINEDLLVSNILTNEGNDSGWHWPLMVKNNRNKKKEIRIKKFQESKNYYFQPPWYGGWFSIIRISYKLLEKIKEFVKINKTLIFGEIFFITLAKKNNLLVKEAIEFKMKYEFKSRKQSLFTKEEIEKDNLYTQIKSKRKKEEFRNLFK